MEDNRRKCVHCDKPDCGTPPLYDYPMCMDCWVKHTPEGKEWLDKYYYEKEYAEQVQREMEEEYYRRQPYESDNPDYWLDS
jgi:hypothetical protein